MLSGTKRVCGHILVYLYVCFFVKSEVSKKRNVHNHRSVYCRAQRTPPPPPRATETMFVQDLFWTKHKSRWFHWLVPPLWLMVCSSVNSNPQVFAINTRLSRSTTRILSSPLILFLNVYLSFHGFTSSSHVPVPSSHIYCPFLSLGSCRPSCWGVLLVSLCE